MENNLPLHVLAVKISRCETCQKTLKKRLLKKPGVDSVEIDTENNLVYVVGEINPTTLVNYVAKMGKSVQLVSADEQKDNNHKKYKGSSSSFASPKNEKPHKNKKLFTKPVFHNSEKKVEQKQEHICEAYVPPVIDPRVCRDFHCKTHPRGRLIVDRVPAENTSSFFGMGGVQMGGLQMGGLQMGGLPYYGDYNPYGVGPYQYPGMQRGWYGQEPPQYGYGWQPQPSRSLPQHPYIFP